MREAEVLVGVVDGDHSGSDASLLTGQEGYPAIPYHAIYPARMEPPCAAGNEDLVSHPPSGRHQDRQPCSDPSVGMLQLVSRRLVSEYPSKGIYAGAEAEALGLYMQELQVHDPQLRTEDEPETAS